jgi:hypothetical protein
MLSFNHQQKNMVLWCFSCRHASSGSGKLPEDVCPIPLLNDMPDMSSNFMNVPASVAARCA